MADKEKSDQEKTVEEMVDDTQPAETDKAKAKPAEATSKTETKAKTAKSGKPSAKKTSSAKKKSTETTSAEMPFEEATSVEPQETELPPSDVPTAEAPAVETPPVAAKADEPKTLTDLADLGAITAAAEAAVETADSPEVAASDEPKTLTDLADLGPAAGRSDEARVYEQHIDQQGRAYATGKRKDAVARVWLKPGAGRVTVNDRDIEVFFARPVLRMLINQPFEAVGRNGQYDVMCTVRGGGLSGQAGAVRHGISKALLSYEPALRPTLKAGGFLTRDARVVERKKYGKRKARRSFQFSKR